MIADKIKNKAAALGYSGCGIIPSDVFSDHEKYLNARADKFPGSKNLYEPLYEFIKPPDECRSIIVCVRGFTKYRLPESLNGRIGKTYLFDTRVTYSNDYRAREEFKAYIGTLGIKILPFTAPSRWAAAKAGLGKFGRNCFIYHRAHGSNIKIEALAVDMELEYENPPEDTYLPGCEPSCHKCIEACPTGALSGDYCMNHAKCITQFTTTAPYEDENENPETGLWLYGCDVCQDVCPYNKNKFTETEDFPLLKELEEYLKPENIINMDEETYLNVIYPRFWYAGKDGLWLWKANAMRLMINSGDEKYQKIIENAKNGGHMNV